MKELEDLTDVQKTVLVAFCDANKWSLSSHIPKEAIKGKVKKLNPKRVKKAISVLVSNGFIMKHPTKHKITYQLSQKGLKGGNQLAE